MVDPAPDPVVVRELQVEYIREHLDKAIVALERAREVLCRMGSSDLATEIGIASATLPRIRKAVY